MKKLINYKHLSQTISALAVGFFVVFILLLTLGYNPLFVFETIFITPFQTKVGLDSLSLIIICFCIVSLSSAFSFKGKIFNIGIPGQMLAAANLTTYIALVFFPNGLAFGWFIFVILGALMGGLVGWFVGVLKSYFNINEVLTTIMMNWIIFFFGKLIYINTNLSDNKLFGSKAIHESFQVPLIFATLIMLSLVLFVWFIFSKTTLGYKIEMVGENEHAAHYAGVETKKIQIWVLVISGAIAGIAGTIYYGTYIGNYRIPLSDHLDLIGFQAITISLLAFRNPFAILVLSIFFGILNLGGIISAAVIPISIIIMSLLTGIIFYAFACFISDQHNLFKRFDKKQIVDKPNKSPKEKK